MQGAEPLLPPALKTIGILGGGQLGCMLAESLYKLGAGGVAFYDPVAASPGFRMTPLGVNASWTDFDALVRFFSMCDIITYEFENVDTKLLRSVERASGKRIWPSVDVLETTQNRIQEKTFLTALGLPCAGFKAFHTHLELETFVANRPLPYILKTARGGYDGKGQALVRTAQECHSFLQQAGPEFFPCVLEEVVPLFCEVSCIVARDHKKSHVVFPVFENVHTHHILDVTLLPASLPAPVQEAVRRLAVQAATELDVVGLLTVEFFVATTPAPRSNGLEVDGYFIYINEFAPRPHNSGHITNQACTMSQFDAHARILLGMPLHTPRMASGQAYCMGNLLGDVWISQQAKGPALNLAAWASHEDVIDVVLYGKPEVRAGRKMGHFVTLAPEQKQAHAKALAFRQALSAPHVDH